MTDSLLYSKGAIFALLYAYSCSPVHAVKSGSHWWTGWVEFGFEQYNNTVFQKRDAARLPLNKEIGIGILRLLFFEVPYNMTLCHDINGFWFWT